MQWDQGNMGSEKQGGVKKIHDPEVKHPLIMLGWCGTHRQPRQVEVKGTDFHPSPTLKNNMEKTGNIKPPTNFRPNCPRDLQASESHTPYLLSFWLMPKPTFSASCTAKFLRLGQLRSGAKTPAPKVPRRDSRGAPINSKFSVKLQPAGGMFAQPSRHPNLHILQIGPTSSKWTVSIRYGGNIRDLGPTLASKAPNFDATWTAPTVAQRCFKLAQLGPNLVSFESNFGPSWSAYGFKMLQTEGHGRPTPKSLQRRFSMTLRWKQWSPSCASGRPSFVWSYRQRCQVAGC